jgi:hypothetical protein
MVVNLTGPNKEQFQFANGKAIPKQRLTAHVRPGAIVTMLSMDEPLDPDVRAWLRDDAVVLRLRGCCGNGCCNSGEGFATPAPAPKKSKDTRYAK